MIKYAGEADVSGILAAWEAPIRACAADQTGRPRPSRKEGVPSKASVEQPDLYYFEAVLVTAGYAIDPERKLPVGWNKNYEFFDAAEAWIARGTPEDKPLNRNHDCNDIVGHITGCSAEALDGTPIASDSAVVPDSFNLVTRAVLYRVWFNGPEDARDEARELDMARLIAEVEDDQWCVSMECLVPDFDYALLNKDGTVELVKRDKKTAHLTAHLRSAGGNGVYGGRPIARVPRQIVFSGKGLVKNPANPKSVVRGEHAAAGRIEKEIEKTDKVYQLQNQNTEPTMEIEAIKSQLAAAEARICELTSENEKLTKGKLAELTEMLAAEKAAKVSLEESMKSATAQARAEVDKLVGEKSKLEGELAEANKKLGELASAKKLADRASAISAALKLAERETALAFATQLAGLSDESFAAHVELLAKAAPAAPENKNDKPIFTAGEGGSDAGGSLEGASEPAGSADLATGSGKNTDNVRMLLAKSYGYTAQEAN